VLQILCFPDEEVEKGDYLLIEEPKAGKALIAQVIDVQFANVPGILEELLRSSPDGGNIEGADFDPLEIAPHITYIQDSRLLICKVRASVNNGQLSPSKSWFHSWLLTLLRLMGG